MPLPPKVLIISEHVDAHIHFVTKHLDVPYLVYDPSIHSLDISFSNARPSITIDGKKLAAIRSVWLRKPSALHGLRSRVAPHHYDYCSSALEAHAKSLYALLGDMRWVSDYHAISRASYKPAQIEAAHAAGFNVPDTLFTSSPAAAKEFIRTHERVITKTLSHAPVKNSKNIPLLFLATDLTGRSNVNLSGLTVAPAIFQTAIDSAGDVRVTVVGGETFAAILRPKQGSKKPGPIQDWPKYDNIHSDGKATEIVPHALPADIRDKCVAHARHFNLLYSAIDLVLDKKGRYWFLENNPNGQWAYIEEATGQPIGKTMAQLLERK